MQAGRGEEKISIKKSSTCRSYQRNQKKNQKQTTYNDTEWIVELFISDYFNHTCPPTFQNKPDINIMLHSINGKINLITK